MPELVYETQFVCDAERIFDFITQPRQAELLSPPDLNITLNDAPDRLSHGAQVRFQVQVLGMTQNFVHEVVAFEPPLRFTEVQREGPFGEFSHEHVLVEADGKTTLTERILFSPPGGMAGLFMTEQRIRDRLTRSLTHGHAELKRRLEA